MLKTRMDLIKLNRPMYEWLKVNRPDLLFKYFKTLPHNYWTFELCRQESLKYKKVSDWIKKSPSSYRISKKRKWVKELTKNMFFEKISWNFNLCKKEASKYSTIKDWKENSEKSYNAAISHGWLKKLNKHMMRKIHPNNYWTIPLCKKEALKHKTRNEWKKNSPKSYSAAQRLNCLEICTKHMFYNYKGGTRKRVLINCSNGKTYESIKEASIDLSLNYSTLKNIIYGISKNPRCKYSFKII